jgi:hypothetical protein
MSYLCIGTSIRIAFSLGFQHDKSPTLQSAVKREQNRRIWSTLIILDQENASRCGSPCVCDERILTIQKSLPSEQVRYNGLFLALFMLVVSNEAKSLLDPESWHQYSVGNSRTSNVTFSPTAGNNSVDLPRTVFRFEERILLQSH